MKMSIICVWIWIALLINIFPIISGLNVAIFFICMPSHINPNIGIIRELIHQNHSVVCIIHRDCHEKLNSFQVDLVHNNGLTPQVANETFDKTPVVFLIQKMLTLHATVHQDVLDYFENNKVDVILSSSLHLSHNHIADKFNVPLLLHHYQLGFMIGEKCRDCKYTGTVLSISPFGSLSPSLPMILFTKLLNSFFTLFLYPSLIKFDSQRKELGLEEFYPKSLVHYNVARSPIVYQNYHPLVPPSIELHDGRWLVGYIPPDTTRRELSEDYLTFLREDSLPVVYVSFGTVVKLDKDQLSSLYQQVTVENGFKVILSLRTEQQLRLIDGLGVTNLDELISGTPKHVKLVKFAPQRELLQTEEVKLFVSHAGFSSVMESISSSTPMILFPVMADQFYNSNIMEEIGCAIQFNDMTTLNSKIIAFLDNYQSYKSCMENANQLMSKAGGAVEVVEILERLSSRGYEGMSFDFYIDNVPDMYSALLTLLSIPAFLLSFLFCLCYCCCCRRNKKAKKVKED